ncbi:MAG TPA: hypothetical protein VJ508_10565 [Saprospiraceae bacterium]|nr:hypothetical protein [Saprospiraceae bacterium]
MKSLLISSVLSLLVCFPAMSQLQFYMLGGICPEIHPRNASLLVNRNQPVDQFKFNRTQVGTQFFMGVQVRMPLNEYFFTEAGARYSRFSEVYTVTYLAARQADSRVDMKEQQNRFTLPVNIGVKLNQVEIVNGFDAVWITNTKSEMDHMPGFKDQSPDFHLGWHINIGLEVNRMVVGAGYQAEFARVGEGMSVNGQSLEIRQLPGQVNFYVQFRL